MDEQEPRHTTPHQDQASATERPARKQRGRQPSPRAGRVHAKVMPNVAREISREAVLRGVQQGVLIEEAWAIYKAQRDGEN